MNYTKSLRIAQIAPVTERVPPVKYGGVERVIHALTEELTARGHRVTLFGSGDSQTSARLNSVLENCLREERIKTFSQIAYWTALNISAAYDRAAEFDIIHDHNPYLSLPLAQTSATPVILTLHYQHTGQTLLYERFRRPYLAAVSKAQVTAAPGLNYAGVVYNGLPMEDYPFSTKSDGYLLFVGRICREKGVRYAIETAIAAKLPLLIAGNQADRWYFRRYVAPHLSGKIKWLGEVSQQERNRLMSRALAFLHPAVWPEPFGLTMIEAMACGCPAIALDNGAISEIVASGRTGFVVRSVKEMAAAVGKVSSLDREFCREYALNKFSAAKMTDGYEKIYHAVIRKKRK